MSQITVRCHPYAPVDTEEVQKWLTAEPFYSAGYRGLDCPLHKLNRLVLSLGDVAVDATSRSSRTSRHLFP